MKSLIVSSICLFTIISFQAQAQRGKANRAPSTPVIFRTFDRNTALRQGQGAATNRLNVVRVQNRTENSSQLRTQSRRWSQEQIRERDRNREEAAIRYRLYDPQSSREDQRSADRGRQTELSERSRERTERAREQVDERNERSRGITRQQDSLRRGSR